MGSIVRRVATLAVALGTGFVATGCSGSGAELGSLADGQGWPVGAPPAGLGDTGAIPPMLVAPPAPVDRATSENFQVADRQLSDGQETDRGPLSDGIALRASPVLVRRSPGGSEGVAKGALSETARVPAQVARAVNRSVAPDTTSVSGLRKGGGYYKVGKPYVIAGITYVPRVEPNYEETGVASWYGEDFHGKPTANGEVFDMEALSAAHRTLPLPSYAYVTNLENGRSLMVRINNRGPFAKGRLIDVSARVARELDFAHKGVANVKVTYAGPAPLDGRDDREEAHLAQRRSGG